MVDAELESLIESEVENGAGQVAELCGTVVLAALLRLEVVQPACRWLGRRRYYASCLSL